MVACTFPEGTTSPWHDERMDKARALLEAERDQALQRLAYLTGDFNDVVEASRDSNADDEHDPEGATIAFERAQVSALAAQARDHLADIDAAYDRLAAGTYGVCSHCGRPIAEGRLEARPTARTCVECAALPA
jgi:RNA polymerase-binding transcription factor DksA